LQDLINAIVELKRRNPKFGCPRIAYTISVTFGIEINKDVVRRILARHYKHNPGNTQGPPLLSLLGHSKDSLWSIDLFRCESLTFQSHWVLVVMDQWSRRIIGFGIHRGDVDGITVCRMFNQAISGADPPNGLSTDNDPLFTSHRWQANLRILDVNEIKSIPYAPMSHPFIERVLALSGVTALITPLSGIHSTWRGSSTVSKTTITTIELMLRCQGNHPQNSVGWRNKFSRASTTMAGNSIVVAYFRRRFQRDYQFAMHRLACL